MATTLENIKAGDTVIRHVYGSKTIEETVERTTKTLIILSNDRRYRRNGYRVGGGSLSDDYIEVSTQEPEQVIEVAKPEPTANTKTETRYRVRVKTFENEIKNYPASTKKEADEIFSRESHPLHSPMENYQVQLQDSGRERTTWSLSVQCDLTRCGSNSRTREEYEAWKVAQVKPQLTPETITYTIVERDEQGQSPFYARVFVPGEEVQDFDPISYREHWLHSKSDLVSAINRQFKGAWYLSAEAFDARVQETQKVVSVASEPVLETVPMEQMPQERDWIKKSYARAQELGIELTGICCTCGELKSINAEGKCQECFTAPEIIELTDEQRNAVLAQKRAESAEYLARIDVEIQVHIADEIARSQVQKQEELQHMEKQETSPIISQIEQTVIASITHGTIPDGVYVDQKYREELQRAKELVICGHDIGILYEDEDFMEGLPVMAYGIHKLAVEDKEEQDTLSDHGRILLNILRDAHQQMIKVAPLGPILQKHLGISDEEIGEIMEIVKADIREECISLPGYEQSGLANILKIITDK